MISWTTSWRNLQAKGSLDRAIAEFQESARLMPTDARHRESLATAVRMQALRPRLPAVLAGIAEPRSAAEWCEFANLCAQPF